MDRSKIVLEEFILKERLIQILILIKINKIKIIFI